MSPKDFLALGYAQWIEIHWTLANTEETARKLVGNDAVLYRVCYPSKSSDGFFAWWAVVE